MLNKIIIPVLAILSLLLFAPAIQAQEEEGAEKTIAVTVPVNVDKGPEDALGRGTPRSSAIGFLSSCSEFDFERAAQYLDLRNLPADVSRIEHKELARQLNHVLSRTVWLDDYNVSDSPEGARGDDLPSYRDELTVIKTPEGDEYPIYMQRVPRGDGESIWKISNQSVAQIPELYDEFSYPEPVENIRKLFPENASILGLETFKWVIMLGLALIAWPILWCIGWFLSRIFSSPESETYPLVKHLFTGPLTLIGVLVVVSTAFQNLGAGAYAQQIADAQTVNTIAIVWAFWALINLYKIRKQNKLIAADRPGAAKLMQPMTTLLKLLVVVFGALFWLTNIGVNITTLLAGLGVGGLAVALALQKPIEDMMGALSIFSQAPFRVGDLVKYGTVFGVVEDIGLRTTRFRTLTNTVVSVPNSLVAYHAIENITYREKIRFWPTLRLRYDTSLTQLKEIRDAILKVLTEHDKVQEEPVRVRFTDFDKDAVLIKIHCFIDTTDYPEYLEIGEDINFQIMEAVEKAGARFALPGRSIQMEESDQPALS